MGEAKPLINVKVVVRGGNHVIKKNCFSPSCHDQTICFHQVILCSMTIFLKVRSNTSTKSFDHL